MKLQFLGRTLGTASGWDGDLGETWWVYDFVPIASINNLACECFQLDEMTSTFHTQDKEGNTIHRYDMVQILQGIPKD